MKKLLLVVGLAVCMVGVGKAELFDNPGFEDGFSGWSDWGSGSGGVGWRSGNWVNVIEDDTALSGNAYVEHGWDLSVGTSWGYSMVYQDPLVVPGDTYTFSAWVRDGWADPANPGAGTIPVRLTFEQRWFTGGGRGEETEPRMHFDFPIPQDGQWHFVSATHTAPLTVNQFTAIVMIDGQGFALDVDDVSLMPNNAHEPQPADASKVPTGLDILEWENPDPNDPGNPITCVVYFSSDYPEAGMYEGDPNFTNYAQSIPVNGDNLSAAMPEALVLDKTYYWRVDCTDPTTGQTVVGHVWEFTTVNDPPVVDAGGDEYIWLVDGSRVFNLVATVTDDGLPDPPGEYTLSWAVTGGDTESIEITDPVVEDAEVTVTAVGTYELTLTADDGDKDTSDTVTVNVYETACDAAKGAGVELIVGDVNEDCVVDMGDAMVMAGDWLSCISLDCM